MLHVSSMPPTHLSCIFGQHCHIQRLVLTKATKKCTYSLLASYWQLGKVHNANATQATVSEYNFPTLCPYFALCTTQSRWFRLMVYTANGIHGIQDVFVVSESISIWWQLT